MTEKRRHTSDLFPRVVKIHPCKGAVLIKTVLVATGSRSRRVGEGWGGEEI
jgi:hypothetical protein